MTAVDEPAGAPTQQQVRRSAHEELSRGDEVAPIGYDPDGCPIYAPCDVDVRLQRLRDTLPVDPKMGRMVVADAFMAVIAPENLAHAEQAVEALDALVTRQAPDQLRELLRRYDNDGLNSDRKIVNTGFAVVAAHPKHAQEAVALLQEMVALAQRRAAHLVELGHVL